MMVTYRKLYEEGRKALRDAGIEDADLDARILLEEVCGTNLQTLLVYPDREIDDGRAERYRAFIRRRASHEPTAMILGKWDFCGLTFRVTADTLIPEQDTERLVEVAVEAAEKRMKKLSESFVPGGTVPKVSADRPYRILDLCTGSGCILLSLLHFLPEAEGIGTDLSEAALKVARENAESLGMEGRSAFLQGDLWDALKDTDGLDPDAERFQGEEIRGGHANAGNPDWFTEKYDLIVSNPPYIPTEVIPTLMPEVKSGEPYMALDGGTDGLAFYRRIIAEAGRHLKRSGIIIVESGFDEAGAIRELFEQNGFGNVRIYQDYGGRDRVVAAEDFY